eukprot:TRINITY_DN7943_c1_g2_i1.p1 TRINITY_DN7943_c1_g2~~TRINITY_DN7943_c1_g2_i1.p1  ORF type:complete len:828 (+),score=267.82 TRINITY_DN7943_c1_g2_i1:1054-3537(+)
MGAGGSKEEFSQRIAKLVASSACDVDPSFWRPVFLTEATLDEIHFLLKVDELRRVRAEYPENLALLIFQCMEQLRHFLKMTKKENALDFKSAVNSLRIITRLMPILFEDARGGDKRSANFVNEFFWNNKKLLPTDPAAVFTNIAGQPLNAPLGTVLMHTLVEMAYAPNFCVNISAKIDTSRSHASHALINTQQLWYGGIGPTENIPSWAALDRNRLDVVTCMLTCCTGPVFQTDPLVKDRFIDALVTCPDNLPTLTFSLLNCIVPYNPAGTLPYSSYMTDTKEPLMIVAVHLLLVVLDNGYLCRAFPEAKEQTPSKGYAAAAQTSENVFWRTVANIQCEHDMASLFNGLVKLLGNPMDAKATWLPGSQKTLDNAQEVLGLLWKILDCNVAFRRFICKEMPIAKLVVPLLYLMWQAKTTREKVPALQVALWIFLLLSGERDFGVSLNEAMTYMPPKLALPVFGGCYLDLVIIVFQQLIQSGVEWVRVSTDGFLTVISNLSPYAKSLCMVSSTKLVNLFEAISSPRFLKSSEDNWKCLSLILQAFNNLIQYQYEGNTPLVYAILRRHTAFEKLTESLQGKGPNPLEGDWCATIPIGTVNRMLAVLYPEVQRFCEERAAAEPEMLSFLQKTTLVGLLPQPHSILIRSYFATPNIYSYITVWAWGLIYNRHQAPQMFIAHSVKLFPIYTEAEDGKLQPLSSRNEKPVVRSPQLASKESHQPIHQKPKATPKAAAPPPAASREPPAKGFAAPPSKKPDVHVASAPPAVAAPPPVVQDTPATAAAPATDPGLHKRLSELQELKNSQSSIQRQIRERQERIQAAMARAQGGVVL